MDLEAFLLAATDLVAGLAILTFFLVFLVGVLHLYTLAVVDFDLFGYSFLGVCYLAFFSPFLAFCCFKAAFKIVSVSLLNWIFLDYFLVLVVTGAALVSFLVGVLVTLVWLFFLYSR